MSEQTYTDRLKVATQKRRKYLWDKLRACFLAGCFAAGAVSVALWTISIVSSKMYEFQHPDSPPCWYDYSLFMSRYTDSHPTGFAPAAGRIATLVVTALLCGVLFRRKAEEATLIPVVPPVADQIAAFLRAEDILVRGCDSPAASATDLLRAARKGATEPPDELLRAEGKSK